MTTSRLLMQHRWMRVHQAQRMALPSEVVVDALHYERAAMLRQPRTDLVGCQPECAQDAVVERAVGFGLPDGADEREAQVSDGFGLPG